jgi:flagellar hook-basal body complex protein FliE
MNPISVIQQFVRPEMPLPLPRADLTATSPTMMPLREIQELPQFISTQPVGAAAESGSFSSLLGRMINEVNAKQAASGEAVHGLMTGQGVPLHEAVIAMEEASVSFQLMVEVRNKMLESYQELMRMQI